MFKLRLSSQITLLPFVAYLSTFFFEAPIRYGLFLINLESLLYIRDLFLIFYLTAIVVCELVKKKAIFLMYFLIFIFYMIVGLICTTNPLQVLFGVKIFFPLFLGITCYVNIYKMFEKFSYLFILFFIIVCCGVILNNYVEYPWTGFSYELGDAQIEGVREWATFGIARLSGLARSSIDAATHVSILYICLLVFFQKKLFHIALLPLALIALFLTTTKGAILAFVLVVITYLLFLSESVSKFKYKISNLMLVCVVLICATTPLLSYIIFQYFHLKDQLLLLLFSSWQDRLENIWPQALELLTERGSLIIGRGIGGIGTAQRYYEPSLYNPGDSLFVYLYCIFGIPSIYFFTFIIYKALFLNAFTSKKDLFTLLILVFFISYGFTTAILENSVIAVILGAAIKHLNNTYLPSKKQQSKLKISCKV